LLEKILYYRSGFNLNPTARRGANRKPQFEWWESGNPTTRTTRSLWNPRQPTKHCAWQSSTAILRIGARFLLHHDTVARRQHARTTDTTNRRPGCYRHHHRSGFSNRAAAAKEHKPATISTERTTTRVRNMLCFREKKYNRGTSAGTI
jgi:hypothetical protein